MKRFVSRVLVKLQNILKVIMTVVSFLMLAVNLGYIIYNQIVCYDSTKVLIGCASLYTMIHLNKSIQ